ncbi:MAG: hypothetical protein IT342_25600 [Candidatus Melainabacteria bacterium]|nr:hypothetical protein [Candidatus Melainabacteria bacterium]
MKLFYGTQAGLPLTGEGSLFSGETELVLHHSLAFAAGAIDDGRILRADLSKDYAGRLMLVAEQSQQDERALVVVDLPLYEAGSVDYMSVRPNREFRRVLRCHTTHEASSFGAAGRRCGARSRYHALLVLSEGTAVRFTATFSSKSMFSRLRGNSRPIVSSRHWRYALEGGEVTLVERLSRSKSTSFF